MITGYNTEIKHRGRLFHVQTEDKGRSNPVIESLIYIGGEILDSIRSSYKDKSSGDFGRDQILALMEKQHQDVLGNIKVGKYDPEPEPGTSAPVGDDLLKKRDNTLDEVVLSLIADKEIASGRKVERMEIELLHGLKPEVGKKIPFELCARTDRSGDPVVGAQIIVRLVSKGKKPLLLYKGETDTMGLASVQIEIPKGKYKSGVLVIQASSEQGLDEIRKPLI